MAPRKTIGQFPIVSIAANPPLLLQIRTLNPHSQQNVSYWAQELWEYQVSLILHRISEFQAYEYRDAHRLKINRNFIAIERKKTTFRAVEDGLSYNEEVADGEKSCWAPWPPRCRRLVRISRSIPDWCRRIHQKRIHTTQTEDRRPALSFVRDHNLYAAHSPQWWLVVASNQAVQRFTFLPPGPLTTQAMGPSPCCSLSPSPGPWITLHTYISEHCDNAALSKFTKIIGHCLEQL